MAGLLAGSVHAFPLVSDYLVIATGDEDKVFLMSNSEIGAIGSNPSTSTSWLANNPWNTVLYRGPSVGVTLDGDAAITNPDSGVTLSNSDVHALNQGPGNEGAQGIDCAGTFDACTDNGSQISSSNRFNQTAPTPVFSTLDENNGIQGEASFGTLLTELGTLSSDYWSLAATDTWNWDPTDTDGGEYVFTLQDGLNVIDINTGGADLYFENTDFIVSGDANDSVIFRVNAGWIFNASESNLLLGGTLGINDVLFLVDGDQGENSFNFNNVAFYGYSFWDYGGRASDNLANWNNVRGCGQVVTDVVNFQNVSMTACTFATNGGPPSEVSEPAVLALLGIALAGLGFSRRRKRAA